MVKEFWTFLDLQRQVRATVAHCYNLHHGKFSGNRTFSSLHHNNFSAHTQAPKKNCIDNILKNHRKYVKRLSQKFKAKIATKVRPLSRASSPARQ